MLQRSKSDRFSGNSHASPRSLDFDNQFRSSSHPIRDFEKNHERNQPTTNPIFDSFTQRNSPTDYFNMKSFKNNEDRRTFKSSKNETISVDIPPVLGRNTLFPTSHANSGAAQLGIPSFRLTSSKSLSSLRTKNHFHSPEVIKPIPSSYYSEKIGIALGSPTHCENLEMKIPLVSYGIRESYVNDCYRQASPKDLKPKANRWKMFEDFFGGKRKKTAPVSAYYRYHGRPRPIIESKSGKRYSIVGKNNSSDNFRRKSVIRTTKKVTKIPTSKIINSSRVNSSPSKADGHNIKVSGSRNYVSLIDVDIPSTKMDRFSVMVKEVNQKSRTNCQPPLPKLNAYPENSKSVNEALMKNKDHDIRRNLTHVKKPSSSSSLRKPLNFPSFREKPPSLKGSPIQPTTVSHKIPTRKPSTCFSIPKNHSVDYRTNNKEDSGSLESKFLNKHYKSHSDTARFEHKNQLKPPVPKKDAQYPVLTIPKESFLDFGFSKLFLKDGYQDFFDSSPAAKQSDSVNFRRQNLNRSHGLLSPRSISSSESSLSSSTMASSIASPLSITPFTGHNEEMKFPTPPSSKTASTSYIPSSKSLKTHRTNSSMSNQSTKKSNFLKKSPSFSKSLESTKSCFKPSLSTQYNKPKPQQAPKLTPFPSITSSNPAKLAANAISSPLDAFTIATNEELERLTYQSAKEKKLKQQFRGGTYLEKKNRFKKPAFFGFQSYDPNVVMINSEQVRSRNSKSLDLTRKNGENYIRDTDSISDFPSWNPEKTPIVDLAAVSVARGIVAREYRKSNKAVIERVSVMNKF